MIKLQNDSQPTPTNAIEIDAAILDIQTRLTTSLSWLTHGHGKTYRNVDTSRGVTVYFPEVFLGGKNYMRITPDNDKQGQSFFVVGSEQPQDYEEGYTSFLTYDLGIVFAANLELINSTLLDTEYYQQNLIQEVRRVLNTQLIGANYKLIIDEVVREFSDVYSEYNIEEKRGISHAPLTHFRFNCTLTLREYCNDTPFDRCATILSIINPTERDCLTNALGGSTPCDYNDCSALLAGMSTATKNTCVLPTYDFTDTDVQNNVTTQQQTDLTNWLCVPACTADFEVADLAHAQQITYNEGDTVCINDVLYQATDKTLPTGNLRSSIEIENGNYYYIVNNGGLSYILEYTGTTTNVIFDFNDTVLNPNSYEVAGELIINNGNIYIESQSGGANGLGGIVKVDIANKTMMSIWDASTSEGYFIYDTNVINGLDKQIYNNELYFVTNLGGVNNRGVFAKINLATNQYTKIYDLTEFTFNIGGEQNLGISKGHSTIYNNLLFVVADDNLIVYDLVGQTIVHNVVVPGVRTTTVAMNGNFTVYNNLFIVRYLQPARCLIVNMDNYTSNVVQIHPNLMGVYGYDMILHNNSIYMSYFQGTTDLTELNLNTFAVTQNTNNPNITGQYTKRVNGLTYYLNTRTNATNIARYDFATNTVTNVITDSTTAPPLSADGVNLIDVSQHPLYLELQ